MARYQPAYGARNKALYLHVLCGTAQGFPETQPPTHNGTLCPSCQRWGMWRRLYVQGRETS